MMKVHPPVARTVRRRSAGAITHISVRPEELGCTNALGTLLCGFPFIFLLGIGAVVRRFLFLQGTKLTFLTGSLRPGNSFLFFFFLLRFRRLHALFIRTAGSSFSSNTPSCGPAAPSAPAPQQDQTCGSDLPSSLSQGLCL